MKKTFAIILTLIGFLAFGQESKLDRIDNKANSIELDSSLTLTEFDWVKLTEIATDGGGILKVWRNDTQICKIVEEIGASFGRVRTTIYLENEIPIKIIETEENFGHKNNELNYEELNIVFKATVYFLDWETDKSIIHREGKRIMNLGNCTKPEYLGVILLAQRAMAE